MSAGRGELETLGPHRGRRRLGYLPRPSGDVVAGMLVLLANAAGFTLTVGVVCDEVQHQAAAVAEDLPPPEL